MAMVKWNKKASMGTALFSAVSLKLCCWGPFLLTGVAGIGGSSVYFSWLIALKPYVLAIAFLSLGFAFYQVYKKGKLRDSCNCKTDKPSFLKSKFYVWLIAVFVVTMTLVSYYPQLFSQTMGKTTVIANQTDIHSVNIEIEGMVCQGCEFNINNFISGIGGVVEVNTSFKKSTSDIKFDQTKTNITEIEEAIKSKGYIIKEYE